MPNGPESRIRTVATGYRRHPISCPQAEARRQRASRERSVAPFSALLASCWLRPARPPDDGRALPKLVHEAMIVVGAFRGLTGGLPRPVVHRRVEGSADLFPVAHT